MSRFTPPASVRTPAEIQSTFEEVAIAINDTLSRKGDSPNQMEADLDLNGNALLNVQTDVNDPGSLVTRDNIYIKAEVDAKDAATLQEAIDYVDGEIGTSAIAPGQNISLLVNDVGYLTTPTDISGKADKIASPVVDNFVKQDASGNVVDAGVSQSSFATATQGGKADTATQPGDNLSTLVNDVGFLTGISTLGVDDLGDVDTTGKAVGRILEFDASGNLVVGDKAAGATTTFAGLGDTPATYAGQAGKLVTVKGTEDGLEFVDVVGAGLVDSVFGRVGSVVATAGDYNSSQVVNSSGVTGITVSNALDTLEAAIPDVSGKADKVGSPVTDNFVKQTALGNIVDAGVSASSFATATQGALASTALQPADVVKTASATDNTAGRVVTVSSNNGWFGIGGEGVSVPTTGGGANDLSATGVYKVDTISTPNIPAGASSGSCIIHTTYGSTFANQIYLNAIPDVAWFRSKVSGSWGSWQQIWTDSSLPVSVDGSDNITSSAGVNIVNSAATLRNVSGNFELNTTGQMNLQTDGTTRLTLTDGGVNTTGSVTISEQGQRVYSPNNRNIHTQRLASTTTLTRVAPYMEVIKIGTGSATFTLDTVFAENETVVIKKHTQTGTLTIASGDGFIILPDETTGASHTIPSGVSMTVTLTRTDATQWQLTVQG